MRLSALAAAVAALTALAGAAPAQGKKGTVVEWAGMKSATPADWKDESNPPRPLRLYTFKLPKADGDSADAELAIFLSPGGGSVAANLERQVNKFDLAGKKKEDAVKTDKIKVGSHEAAYQDIQGTFLSKNPPFDPNAKVTKMEGYRQLYVIFEAKDGVASMYLIGPAKTVEKHKKEFEEWVKNFK
jgi:hypothetical protein